MERIRLDGKEAAAALEHALLAGHADDDFLAPESDSAAARELAAAAVGV